MRRCYPKLFERIVALYHAYVQGKSNFRSGVIITGNPGIGKTFMLWYILWNLAHTLKATVVLQLGKEKLICLFQPNKPPLVVESDMPAFPELDSRETIFLYDPYPGVEPRFTPAFTIVASSPNDKNFKEFFKRSTKKLYMPTWDWDELQQCNKELWRISDAALEKNFLMFGGIPRHILSAEEYASELEIAIRQANIYATIDSIGNLEAAPQESHKILQYEVTDDFKVDYVRFATSYVRDELCSQWSRKRAFEMEKLYLQLENSAAHRKFLGDIWQFTAAKRLLQVSSSNYYSRLVVPSADDINDFLCVPLLKL